jgi:Fe-S-cluster containining protein
MEKKAMNELPVIQQGPGMLPQIVPSGVCLSCSVCCRFPEPESVLRPFFTREEIHRAVEAGLSRAYFTDENGSQITLVSHPAGDGYLCPAFDVATSTCRIYTSRPFDCQIYPLAIMWSEDHREILLGWDTKCPFIESRHWDSREALGVKREAPMNPPHQSSRVAVTPDASPLMPHEITQYAERMAHRLETDESYLGKLIANPGLIGPYQGDVQVLRSLPAVTERLNPSQALHLLTVDDRAAYETAVRNVDSVLACYAFAPQYVWRDHFRYSWTTLADHFCLFANNDDGMFMPLPPMTIEKAPGTRPEPDAFASAVRQAFVVMRQHNGGRSGVARIEGVSEEQKPELEQVGCRVMPKATDYLYPAKILAALAGDRYKSQRNACNRFASEHRARVEPYRLNHRQGCWALYRRWMAQQEAREDLDGVARHMLSDAASAHKLGLWEADAVGLVGHVVWVERSLCAYTLGYALPGRSSGPDSVFCVLFEIADRSIPGLAQFIFRECCRYAADHGFQWINTMDDSGLPSLARSKQAYHPAQLVQQYIAMQP